MRVLVLSDLHLRVENLKRVLEKVPRGEISLILVCGDLTNFGGHAEEELRLLEFAPILAVPGNLDTGEVIGLLEKRGISLHGKKKRIGKFVFAGFGGALLGSPGEVNFSEEEIYRTLKGLLRGEKNVVLVTHLPPKGTKIDLTYGNVHIGSESVGKIIEEFQPVAHFCGHAHEAAGEVRIGKTTSINVGPVKEGKALIADLEKMEMERVEA